MGLKKTKCKERAKGRLHRTRKWFLKLIIETPLEINITKKKYKSLI